MSLTLAGFADPALDAQAVFRVLMDAVANPGAVHPLRGCPVPPAPLAAEAAAAALALCDQDTPVWLDPALAATPPVAEWLRFHTGAPFVDEPRRCAFALVSDPLALPPFDRFDLGTAEYPDRSTTLVIQVASFSAGAPLVLAGPGIPGSRTFAASPLPTDLPERLVANRALFPRGVDLILVGAGAAAALPRSTRVERG